MPGKTNVKRAKEAKKRIEDSREGRKWFKADEGDTQIRLLPPWADHLDWPFFETKNHRLNDKTFFICPKGHDGETFCYTCDVAIPTLAKGNEDDQARSYNIRPTKRIYCNILDRGDEEVGAQIWGISPTRYDELVSYFSDPDYRDITDVDAGHDLTLNRKGTTKDDTSYLLRARPKKTPVNNDEALNNLFNLDEVCTGPPAEEQRRMLKEALGLSFEDDDDDETPHKPEDDEVSEDDTGFSFGDKPEVDSDASVKATEPKDEPEDESDAKLVPIQIPSGLKGKMKEIYMAKSQSQSSCFGKLFDEDANECVDSCQAVIECMGSLNKG